MRTKRLILLIIFSFLGATPLLSAQQSELDEVVVTASSYPTNINSTFSNITIINKEKLEQYKTDNFIELLGEIPGIYIDGSSGRGTVSSIYLRGGDPNFTVVMINGVQINDPTNSRGGSFDFSNISTENIERIEIVKGPLSYLYGSDSLSGVINIITKKGSGQQTGLLDLSYSKDKGFRTVGEVSGVISNLNYSFSVSYIDDGEPVDNNKFTSPSIFGSLGYKISDKTDIDFFLRYSNVEKEGFPDDSGGNDFAEIREADKSEINSFVSGLSLSRKHNDNFEQKLIISFFYNNEDFASPGVAPGIRDPFGIPSREEENTYKRFQFSLNNSVFYFENTIISFGIDGQYEDASSRGKLLSPFEIPTSFDLNRYDFGLFSEVQYFPIDNLSFIFGLRIDLPEDFDTEFIPRIGVNYFLEQTSTSFLVNYSEGFKLPSFFALGNPIVGDDELNPEKSKSVEFIVSQVCFDQKINKRLSLFYNKFEDLIDFDEGPPPVLVNRDKVDAKGIEYSLDINLNSDLGFGGNISYIKTNIINSDEKLRNRPEWLGNVYVNWKPEERFNLYISGNYIGETLDSSIPTADVTLDDYFLLNGSFTYLVNKNFKIYLHIENILDTNYEQFVGFDTPGFRPTVGVQATF